MLTLATRNYQNTNVFAVFAINDNLNFEYTVSLGHISYVICNIFELYCSLKLQFKAVHPCFTDMIHIYYCI